MGCVILLNRASSRSTDSEAKLKVSPRAPAGLRPATPRPPTHAPPPRVRHHVFELWDANTDELLAVTAGFGVGRAYHDYSMAALVRDKRSAGQVLTKTIAALLQKLGYGLWYWGFKNPYMAQYDRFGGRNIARAEFNDRWDALTAAEPDGGIEDAIAAGAALVAPRRSAPPHARTARR